MANQSTSRILDISDLGLVDYQAAWDLQTELHRQVVNNERGDILLLLEHPNTYTLGKIADENNLIGGKEFLEKHKISVFNIDRGGDITYHGPGQIVGYPIIKLENWEKDTHKYLRALEQVIINVCAQFGIRAGRNEAYTGVWIEDRKIAAIGIKVSRWVTMHGFAFNINTDLELFNGIIPCGISDKRVTSLQKELGEKLIIDELKDRIADEFKNVFSYSETLKVSSAHLSALES